MTVNHMHTPLTIATRLRHSEARTLRELGSVLRHPRSLARPGADWRPPSRPLPGGRLTLALTRHRVGERVRARVRGFGENRVPPYLVTARITDSRGDVDPVLAEAWIRAFVEESLIDAVHEVPSGRAATFVWLVDARFLPVHSPASLFAGFTAAA